MSKTIAATASIHVIHAVGSVAREHGGLAAYVSGLCRGLAQLPGLTQTLLSPQRADEWELPAGIERPTSGFLGRWRGLKENLRRPNVALHVHGLWLPELALWANEARAAGVPVLIAPHGMLQPWALTQGARHKRIAWSLYQAEVLRSASAVHATGEPEATRLRALGVRQKIFTIPGGIDIPNLPREQQAKPVRQALFLGRLHPVKGLPDLLEAWARLRPPAWRLVIAGMDEAGHLCELRAHAQRLGLAEAVEFRPAVFGAEKQRLFADCDLFILPSHSENFGLVVAEALAAGLPIIASRATPWADLERKHCGRWVPVGVDGVVAGLTWAFGMNSNELIACGERGRSWACEAYSWSSVAGAAHRAYGELLARDATRR